jgi:type II secretory pathway component PulJ
MLFYTEDRKKTTGFTLIEIMTATTILVLIVMIISAVFHQATIAWDSGNRKAKGTMSARAALGIISSWMTRAVAPPSGFKGSGATSISHGSSSADFVILTMQGTNRAAQPVRVSQSGGSVVMDLPNASGSATIITNVDLLEFNRSDGGSGGSGSLPESLTVRLELIQKYRVSGLGVMSYGPDAQDDGGTDDDITSW